MTWIVPRRAGGEYGSRKVLRGTGTELAEEAQREGLIIPGRACSRRAMHFRVSYAAEDGALERGVEVLRRLARG
jgi:hypothetical protein